MIRQKFVPLICSVALFVFFCLGCASSGPGSRQTSASPSSTVEGKQPSASTQEAQRQSSTAAGAAAETNDIANGIAANFAISDFAISLTENGDFPLPSFQVSIAPKDATTQGTVSKATLENVECWLGTALPNGKTWIQKAVFSVDTSQGTKTDSLRLNATQLDLTGLETVRKYKFFAAFDKRSLEDALSGARVQGTRDFDFSIPESPGLLEPVLGSGRLISTAELDLSKAGPLNVTQWILLSGGAAAVNRILSSVTDDLDANIVRGALKSGLSDKDASLQLNLAPEDFAIDGNYEIIAKGRYRNGLGSSWRWIKEISVSHTDPLTVYGPLSGEQVLSRQTGFYWQESIPPTKVQLNISLQKAGTGQTNPQSQSLSLDSLKPIVDLALLFPAISKLDQFSYTLSYLNASDSPSALSSQVQQGITYRNELDDRVQVVLAGEKNEFEMGSTTGAQDEKPAHLVVLSRAFSALRSPLSNAAAAELLNHMLRRGKAHLVDAKVLSNDGIVLAGLATLDYGSQLGLVADGGNRILVVPGKDGHPAVGFSYFGAKALAAEAATVLGLGPGKITLPSEAEWEFMASGGGNYSSPWGVKPDSRTANFLRSGDPFEDPNPPYNRRSGPTVPNGYFDKIRSQLANSLSPAKDGLFNRLKSLDILGNVWEWTDDRYRSTWYSEELSLGTVENPGGPAEPDAEELKSLAATGQQSGRVVRGGSWNSSLAEIYARNRGSFAESATSFSIGFRFIFL